MKYIIRIVMIGIFSYVLGYVVGSIIAKASEVPLPSDDIERIGIFSQPDGYQMIEVCRETGLCNHYKVKDKDLETWEMPDEEK